MYSHILIPTDGSARSEEAVRKGVQLAHELGARVTCFHVIPPPRGSERMWQMLERNAGSYAKAAMAYAAAHMRFAAKAASACGVECNVDYGASGEPAAAILKAAKALDCDLIVMASHGRRGVEGFLLGSETQKVLTQSKIPVLVYR